VKCGYLVVWELVSLCLRVLLGLYLWTTGMVVPILVVMSIVVVGSLLVLVEPVRDRFGIFVIRMGLVR
jgi:hypothetical protein